MFEVPSDSVIFTRNKIVVHGVSSNISIRIFHVIWELLVFERISDELSSNMGSFLEAFSWDEKITGIKLKKKIKSVAYSSQRSQNGQLDFCNWLADGSTTG